MRDVRILAGVVASVALTVCAACASLPLVRRSAPERWGFTTPWDARSYTSALAHGTALDALVVDWISLDSLSGLPAVLYADSLSRVLPGGMRRMAIVTSRIADEPRPALIRRLAGDSALLGRTARAIAERAQRGGARGVVLDFEGMTSGDTALTRAVVATIAGVVRARGAGPVVVAIPATDTSGYPARILGSADLLLVKLYDQHWSTSPPGAIASPEWVRRSLALRVAESGASRLVAALPLYGYQWRSRGQPALAISHADAVRLAAEAGVALERDPASSTLRASRPGTDGWDLWVSDAVLLDALHREVSALRVRTLAYWRLGLEDPAFR